MTAAASIRVRVAETETVARDIKRFRLVPVDMQTLPAFSGGAHTVVTMRAGDRLTRNPYSLMGSPYDPSGYEISVLKTPNSRGGSIFMHDEVASGSELTISHPVNLFPIDRRAKRHLLIAGGIGITPFLSMTTQLATEGAAFELHYCVRSAAHGAYLDTLTSLYGSRVHTYFDDRQQAIPLARLLDGQPLGTHLYVCGPTGMIDWVLTAARRAGWPDENVHYERFSAPPTGVPFTIELQKSRKTIEVSAEQSMLEAIEMAGIDPNFLCRGGACGQCETAVISSSCAIEHNDHFLSAEEHASGKKIMICVSRLSSTGERIVLDL